MMKRLFGLAALGMLVATAHSMDQQINLIVSKNIAPAPKVRVQINTQNVPSIRLDVFRVDPVKYLSRPDLMNKRPTAIGAKISTLQVKVAAENQKPRPAPQDTWYQRSINLPMMKPGVYLLQAVGVTKGQTWAVVNVTNLAVISKRSPYKVLAWVNDFRTGKPVAGASINLYCKRGELTASQKTAANGLIVFPRPVATETMIVSHDGDFAGLPSAAESPDLQLTAHFQTDRPVYRPGQTVKFKAIVRRTHGQGYDCAPGERVMVSVRDSMDTVIDRMQLTTSAFGTVAGETDIPEEGALGAYTLVLEAGRQTAYQTFTVAAYRKPEFKVTAKPTVKRALAGETIRFEVGADYYFGAAVPQAEVKYTVRRDGLEFWSSDDEGGYYNGDGNLYASDTYGGADFTADGTVYTDKSGRAIIEIRTDPKAGDSTYELSVTVTDGSRRQVTGDTSIPVYAAGIRLGIRSTLNVVPLGHLIPMVVNAIDLDGKPVAANVRVEEHAQIWNEKAQNFKDVVVASNTVKVPANKKGATVDLPAKAEGGITLLAIADDGTGRKAHGVAGVYVVDPFAKVAKEREGANVALKLDKGMYAPGETVKAYVTTSRPEGDREMVEKRDPKTDKLLRLVPTGPAATAILMVVEGGDIFDARVLSGGKRAFESDVKTTLAMSPNAIISVTQWATGQELTAQATVPLPDPARKLTVTLTPNKQEYRPGEPATYKVHAVDSSGKPVAAELALGVVDEAIYAVSPDHTADLYQTYWGMRENRVSNYGSAPEEVSGGAYQRVSSVAPVRQRFEDTAYWNAFVTTNAQGEGEVTFEMPGNLTSWRAIGRAITTTTQVGEARVIVKATRPVTLRLATPRQMVVGDRINLIATVNNRTDQARDFVVTVGELMAKGPIGNQALHIGPNSEGKAIFPIEARGSVPVRLSGEVVDSSRPKDPEYADALQVDIPIVANGVSETMLTAGVVNGTAKQDLTLPADSITPFARGEVRIWAGFRPIADNLSASVMDTQRYGTMVAASQLSVAADMHYAGTSKEVREAIALLSRTQNATGWGWWERAPADPYVTAAVLRALVKAQKADMNVPDRLMQTAIGAAKYQYEQTNLWDHRGVLAGALMMSNFKEAVKYGQEVREQGQNLSPFSKLSLARGFLARGYLTAQMDLVDSVNKDASRGPNSTYVPIGEGIGWRATELETNALLLTMQLADHETFTPQLATWLVENAGSGWVGDRAALVEALVAYANKHREPTSLGDTAVTVNGKSVPVAKVKVGEMRIAKIPAGFLNAGENSIVVSHSGGEARWSATVQNFRPVPNENALGIRVIRRYEVKNEAGSWVELNRPVRPNEPVRCSSVVWGDSVPDAIRITEPIPAGFEFTEEEYMGTSARQEIRDGAVVHYVIAGGEPLVFRYFLRAETEGRLAVLPASAEVLRRPDRRGQSGQTTFEVKVK